MRSLFLLLALAACATAPVPPADTYGYVADQIAPSVAVLRQPSFHVQPRGNVGIVEQGAGVVLIDSGGSRAGAEDVIAAVRRRTDKPVTAIVLTHWHGDHVLGVSRLLQEWPQARVIAAVQTDAMLRDSRLDRFMPGSDEAANDRFFGQIAQAAAAMRTQAGVAPTEWERSAFNEAARDLERHASDLRGARRVPATETFTAQLTIPDDVLPIEIMRLGAANTDGDALVWLPRQRVLFTGDVVVSPIPYGYGGAPTAWMGVLERIKQMPVRTLVPGHGAPQHDFRYVDRLSALLASVRDQAGAERVDLSAQRALFVGDDPWLARWFDAFWTGPIVANARKEARGEAIVQGE